MTLIIYALLAGVAVVFVLSILAPFKLLKGKARPIVAGLVLLGWGVAFWLPKHQTDRRLDARAQCTQESAQLPEAIVVDGFLDDAAALRKESIFRFFAERHIRFLEIRVREWKDFEGQARRYIAMPDGDQEQVWIVDYEVGSYARLELGTKGDPLCAKPNPSAIQNRFDAPPFLPDTCLKLSNTTSSSARYVLTLEREANEYMMAQGQWALIDRQSGQAIARLTTSDNAKGIGSRQISPVGAPRGVGCDSPHTMLADRIIAADDQAWPERRVFRREQRIAATPPTGLADQLQAAPLIEAVEDSAAYTQDESGALFRPQYSESAWAAAVDQAKAHGSANLGSTLVDWPGMRLVDLAPTAQGNLPNWIVLGVNGGFIAMPNNPSWLDTNSNLLVRYAADGSVQWAARIARPSHPAADRRCRKFWPQAAFTEGEFLVLSDVCERLGIDEARATGKEEIGMRLKVPLRLLPGPL